MGGILSPAAIAGRPRTGHDSDGAPGLAGRERCRMRQKVLIALLLGLVAFGAAACDKCGNFLGQPTGQPRGCK
jgi:hypothetical protein